MKRCYNCGSKLVNGGITTPSGSFCNSDCAHGMVLEHQCIEHQPVPEPVYEVKFIAEEPIPTFPIPESVTSRIKKHCTRCATIIGTEGWKGINGVFCSKECAMGEEIAPVTAPPPVKEEITVFDHYAAAAIAALLGSNNYTSHHFSDIVSKGIKIAAYAMGERKKHIKN